MPGPAFLHGETVTLTPVEEEDLEFLQRLVNDPRVWKRLGAHTPTNMHQEEQWFERVSEDESGEHFLVCVERGGGEGGGDGAGTVNGEGQDGDDSEYEPVGTVGLHEVNETWGGAELGYFVAPERWGNGYATEAVELVCEYAFAERRLNKVAARAFAHNEGSRRVLEKVGFAEEGVHRQEAFVGGEYVDTVYYGLLAEEWTGRE